MTPEQILALIKAHKAEYLDEAETEYRQAMTCDKPSDCKFHSEMGAYAVAKATALSRLVLEMTSLEAGIRHLLDAEQIVIRQRDREGQPPAPESEGK